MAAVGDSEMAEAGYALPGESSEGEWELEVDGFGEGDGRVEPALLVIVHFRNLTVLGKSQVLLRVLEKLQGTVAGAMLSVQESLLPRVDSEEGTPCWLVRADLSGGTALLEGCVGKALQVPSAGVPGYPPGGGPEISVECGGMVSRDDVTALLLGAKGLASFASLGLGLFTGAAIVGTGIVRCVQGMPWSKGAVDLCAQVIEQGLGKHARGCGYSLALLPCSDRGSALFGLKLARAAPAGKPAGLKMDVALGAKFYFRAKPLGEVAGEAAAAAPGPLVLPLVVPFPLGGVGVISSGAAGAKVKATKSSTKVDMYYSGTAGWQARRIRGPWAGA